MLLLGSIRVSALNFINTEVSQKYWDEAVKVVRTHEAGSRSHFQLLFIIIFLLITVSLPTVHCVDFWPARVEPSSGWRLAPALWANIAATLGTM